MHDFLLPSGLIEGEPPYWYSVVGSSRLVLILEPGGEHDAFVSRYNAGLQYLTDSWHPTREDALSSCQEEFGEDLSAWRPVPRGETDVEGFVRQLVVADE